MKVRMICVIAMLGVAAWTGGIQADEDYGAVAIVVSPKVINLDSDVDRLTVHSDIPLRLVDRASLVFTLDGEIDLPIEAVFADARGDLVLKLTWDVGALGEEKVEELVANGRAEFTLDGATTEGESLFGACVVPVIKVGD